jgi:aminopeptidase N
MLSSAQEFSMISLIRYAPALVFASLTTTAFAAPGRLPAGVIPIHYDIRVNPDATKLSFTGSETILVKVSAPTSTITLNAVDLNIGKAALDGVALSTGKARSASPPLGFSRLIIRPWTVATRGCSRRSLKRLTRAALRRCLMSRG